MRAAFYTLGCKVNQYETQALEQLLTRRGHTLVPFEDCADAYIINTCTVTAVSDKKSRQVIRRARKDTPDAVIAVCGCYPQTHPEDMAGLSVDLVSGTGDRTGFVELLERTHAERAPITALDDAMKRRIFETLPAGGLEGRTRSMLKVEDGCVNFCTYCIIPFARGPIRSQPLEQTWQQRQPVTALDDAMKRRVFESLPAGGLEGRTRAMLKVEDGCVNFCTYCIIPYAPGPIRSLSLEQAKEQAAQQNQAG